MLILSFIKAPAKEGLPISQDPFQADWTIAVFLLAFALLAWVRASYPFRLRSVLDCIRAPRLVRQRVRDEEAKTHPAAWALFTVTVLSGALFLYQHHLLYGLAFLNGPSLSTYGVCLIIILAALLLKLLSFPFLRHLLGIDPGLREYRFHFLLLIEALGILLLPLTLFNAFLRYFRADQGLHVSFPPEWGFYISYPLMAFAFLMLIFRGISIAKTHRVPSFYIFLYLCTLEILPLIVLSKAFIDHY
ncbi:MAG: DUF4271 domain-containing protein [Flavobacteriales bacterium]